MSEYLNAECLICEKKYHVCHSCTDMKTFKPWRTVACSSNCYSIFKILSEYNNGYINKDEAREYLKQLNLSEINTFKENIKSTIENILKENKKKSIRSKKTNTVEDTAVVSENNAEDIPTDYAE